MFGLLREIRYKKEAVASAERRCEIVVAKHGGNTLAALSELLNRSIALMLRKSFMGEDSNSKEAIFIREELVAIDKKAFEIAHKK